MSEKPVLLMGYTFFAEAMMRRKDRAGKAGREGLAGRATFPPALPVLQSYLPNGKRKKRISEMSST